MSQSVSILASMDSEGRLLVPVEALRAAGIEGCVQFVLDSDPENGQVTLSAAPIDDSWAYTPEDLASLERGKADSRAGRVRRLTESQIRDLMKMGNA
jgi:bifunctional DNA-binding transcriptional regulator/antitoxin component of YhaV-PrlF toxin-antitoxin module